MSNVRNVENLGSEAVVSVQEERFSASTHPSSQPSAETQTAQERLDRVIALQRFLAEANAILASSLDYETTLRSVARLAVPQLADWCTVNLVDEDNRIRRIVVAHKDPAKLAWAEAMEARYPHDSGAQQGLRNVLSTGKSEFYPQITDEILANFARNEEHLELLRQVGLTAVMMAPMRARGRMLGVITFISAESGRSYTPDDLAAAEDLALNAAMAVDNARLFSVAQQEIDVRRRVEAQLQSSQERLLLAIREANHRVLNNLQKLAAMIDLQLMDRPETLPVTEFARLVLQIDTLGVVHIVLTRSLKEASSDRGEKISARSVLSMLLPKLQPPTDKGQIRSHLEDVLLSSRRATSLGFVTTELCSNVFRHGGGEAQLTLTTEGEMAVLEVCDSGPGFPPDFDPTSQATTGMELILALTHRDLHGEVYFVNRPQGGAQVRVVFPQVG